MSLKLPKESQADALAAFTVELDVYSGPYEGLLTLILKDELEIFEVPLGKLVNLYRSAYHAPETKTDGALERDTDFVDSATSLVLLKGRALTPVPDAEEGAGEEYFNPQDLEERLVNYLKIRRGAEALRERFDRNAHFYPSAHSLCPRRRSLILSVDRLAGATRRAFLRTAEPEVGHLGPIAVTIEGLAALIRMSLTGVPLSFEDLVRDMDRLHSAVAFAATLTLASQGYVNLSQKKPFGPLILEPTT